MPSSVLVVRVPFCQVPRVEQQRNDEAGRRLKSFDAMQMGFLSQTGFTSRADKITRT